MARACVTVRIETDSVLSDHSFVNREGESRVWLDIGHGELGLYGAPDAVKRLAAALAAAAERSEQLACEHRDASSSPAVNGVGARAVAAS